MLYGIMLHWTWECKYLFNILFSFPLDRYPDAELLNKMVVFKNSSNFLTLTSLFPLKDLGMWCFPYPDSSSIIQLSSQTLSLPPRGCLYHRFKNSQATCPSFSIIISYSVIFILFTPFENFSCHLFLIFTARSKAPRGHRSCSLLCL